MVPIMRNQLGGSRPSPRPRPTSRFRLIGTIRDRLLAEGASVAAEPSGDTASHGHDEAR
jgi:hypothetical protein